MEVFKFALQRITSKLGKEVEVVDCEHEFRSYHRIFGSPLEDIKAVVEEDLAQLTEFYKEFHLSGGRAIFRTALNAETLYRFRAIGKAVKSIYIPLAEKSILFVRDQMQGFYANESCEIDRETIRFSGSFSRDNFDKLARYSLAEAARTLRPELDVWIVYKHHLFANVIENWAHEVLPACRVYQPNHATQLLGEYMATSSGPDLLLITGNEVGDILHEVLIQELGLGTRSTLYSRNTYLHPELEGLVEYQTVHGSADNIAGQGSVNPLATLRAVAAFVEEQVGENGFVSTMDRAIGAVQSDYDSGRLSSTSEVTEAVLKRLRC